MENAVTALQGVVTADALWGVFTTALPFVGTVVVVSLGMYFIRRLIKGISKAKAKI